MCIQLKNADIITGDCWSLPSLGTKARLQFIQIQTDSFITFQ